MTRSEPHSTWPPLDPVQQAQTQAVETAVRGALDAAGGWLSFAEYLRIVLYAPGLGYYSAGSTKFGRDGDFITAPELSPLFGRALARQCGELLRSVPGDILELGAGTGQLALTLLSTLAQQDQLPQRYLILEVSADLAARQRALLAQLPAPIYSRISWLTHWPDEPIQGLIIANEVADALPFERFVVRDGGFDVRGVALGPDGLVIADRPATTEAAAALAIELARVTGELPRPLREGYASEVCPLLDPWIAGTATVLKRGMVLLFDYGIGRAEYYHPQRDSGTMRCHFRHRAHDDPLLYPGLQDITAWVDFTRVAEAAVEHGLEVCNYCTQAAFLLACGIEADVAAAADAVTRARLAAEARQLLLPGEMGEHFKFMALGRDAPELSAVSALQDLRRLL